jgi:hypothetical protein
VKAMFYLANAYYNMSFHGNSWAMVRYWYSMHEFAADETAFLHRNVANNKFDLANYAKNNYFSTDKARFYYQKAMDLAIKQKNAKLAALCLRYIAQCENVKTAYYTAYYTTGVENNDETPSAKRLAQRYPQYAKQLLSGDCTGWNVFLR